MLKAFIYLCNIRSNCIINIYIKCMSTKFKGRAPPKTIFSTKDGLALRSIDKNKKPIYLNKNGQSSKDEKSLVNSKENNSKIFSLLETSTLLRDPATCRTNQNNVDLKSNLEEGVCRSPNYFNIMASTKSNTDEIFDYDKYQEDCLAESKRLKGFRKWSTKYLGQNVNLKRDNSSMFTLLSFNILAQNLLDTHRYLYKKNDPRALVWSHRINKILEEIISYNAEIICLQEVQEEHISYLKNALSPLNYKYVHKRRTKNHKDGSAIFYKSNVFTMLDYKLVEYFRPNVDILNKDNVGIVIKLKLNEGHGPNSLMPPESDIVIATTHLLYNPKRSDIRLAQAQVMMAELDKMAYVGKDNNGIPQYLPIILTGDFNLQPHTAVYTFLTRGILQYTNLTFKQLEPVKHREPRQCSLLPPHVGINDNCQYIDVIKKRLNTDPMTPVDARDMSSNSGLLIHNLNLTSSYYHMVGKNQSAASTYQDEWITVDYIFYSRGANESSGGKKVGHLELLSRLELPTIPECNFMGPIPNLVFGSDHLLLGAKFIFNR